jgi:hypothetical protein
MMIAQKLYEGIEIVQKVLGLITYRELTSMRIC